MKYKYKLGKVQKEKVNELRYTIKHCKEQIDSLHKSLAVFKVDCEHLASEHFENIKELLEKEIKKLESRRYIASTHLDRYTCWDNKI